MASRSSGTTGNRSDPSAATHDAIAENLSPVIRQEVERAKAELAKEFLKPGRRPAMLAGSGFAAYMTLLFVSIAVWWGLSSVMDQSWAALIVAVVWAAVCAFLYVAAKGRPRPGRAKSASGRRAGRHKSDDQIETAWGRAPVS